MDKINTLIAACAALISIWAIYEAKFAREERLRAIKYEITSDADWNIVLLGSNPEQRAPDKIFATPIYITSKSTKGIKIGERRAVQLPIRTEKDGRPKYQFSKIDSVLCSYESNRPDCENYGVARIRFEYVIGGIRTSAIVSKGAGAI
ncbi:MAG: hypothetical protein MI824_03745 [Hyphomicrobiales bacterium]|nr:hypothetical protein [Hyphomicrobiales bacterium]